MGRGRLAHEDLAEKPDVCPTGAFAGKIRYGRPFMPAMSKRILIALLAGLMVAAAAVPVLGATGGMSAGETVRWAGKAPGLGVIGQNDQLLARYGEAPGCDPIVCDLHELQIGEPGELVVTAADGIGEVEVDVFRPDGTFLSRIAPLGSTTVVTIPDVKPGRYLVQVTTNQSIDRGGAFRASATLR